MPPETPPHLRRYPLAGPQPCNQIPETLQACLRELHDARSSLHIDSHPDAPPEKLTPTQQRQVIDMATELIARTLPDLVHGALEPFRRHFIELRKRVEELETEVVDLLAFKIQQESSGHHVSQR